ncbi:MAG: tRNA glutamyl-Q(34) synthetase GluQRS [Kangiellaceae bacterium]|nr:tRNA glutamyl-Q(34) synthetase GluQRS [Kangiellaceae bacterium]
MPQEKPNTSLPRTTVGRFAPSPTGPLHLGSLVAAIASYMIAKHNGGRWLVRIEDLDPPREVEGATHSILRSLEDFGLHWDGEIIYQSHRSEIYLQFLEELKQRSVVYPCDCSRRTIEGRNSGIYDGYCRERLVSTAAEYALRIKFDGGFEAFYDQINGQCKFKSRADTQDFIIKRRDGLFAYQLAVVADDIDQGIDHVVRGMDIIDSTPRQNYLYYRLNKAIPDYFHIPLVSDEYGVKFSKRSGSVGIDKAHATELLLTAFSHLNQPVESFLSDANVDEIIKHYFEHWQTDVLKIERPGIR